MGRFFGGGAANVSAVIASLGGKPRLFSVAGEDFISSGYASHLSSLGVDISNVRILEGMSAHAFIFNSSKGEQITFFYWGVSKRMEELEIPDDLEFVHIATGDAEVNRRIANSSDFLSFDAGQDIYGYERSDILEILKFTNILFANEHEMEFIKERCGMSEREISEMVDVLVITLGERGSRVISGKDEIFVPSLRVNAIDPTGAGDAYKGGFLYA
ncbi:MAG: nucleoside kinase, partial [Archaeoglobi archaeon]|nr:nucleoside kinase [Archaeoglobi archaeon]